MGNANGRCATCGTYSIWIHKSTPPPPEHDPASLGCVGGSRREQVRWEAEADPWAFGEWNYNSPSTFLLVLVTMRYSLSQFHAQTHDSPWASTV
ncbi:hypothetical protein Hypma_005631 [Hypsizygus marmoreus]|uniref:Uncharacterized protein n=1 Tax=Hypsizygus marmoreus TaxID=39966 RepID=A0A369K450_HYPMA|nr:hypothetical protein Hypma_005631 [Hypsizygus marmoreus]